MDEPTIRTSTSSTGGLSISVTPRFRFRREILRFNADGNTDEFEWPQGGSAGVECARGLYDGDGTPCVEVIWRERAWP